MADCAHAGLTQIPKSLPKDTDWLILSGNNISSVQVVVLQLLYGLSKLQLQNNNIKYISEHFVQYLNTQSNLIDLNISNNELKGIPSILQSSKKKLRKLSLSGNKFDCNCNNIWMKNWLITNRKIVQTYDLVECQMESGEMIPFVEISDADLTCASMNLLNI